MTRLQSLALIAALSLAVVASVFAIWPVVADAPWEESKIVQVEVAPTEDRCEEALARMDGLLDLADLLDGAEESVRQDLLDAYVERRVACGDIFSDR